MILLLYVSVFLTGKIRIYLATLGSGKGRQVVFFSLEILYFLNVKKILWSKKNKTLVKPPLTYIPSRNAYICHQNTCTRMFKVAPSLIVWKLPKTYPHCFLIPITTLSLSSIIRALNMFSDQQILRIYHQKVCFKRNSKGYISRSNKIILDK